MFGNKSPKPDFPGSWKAPSLKMEPRQMSELLPYLYKNCLQTKTRLNLMDSRDVALCDPPLQMAGKIWALAEVG